MSALKTLYREDIELTGASRTDAGVHALQNFFHFDTDTAITQKQVYNLNAILFRIPIYFVSQEYFLL